MTRDVSPSENLAVWEVPPALEIDWPMPMASDDEKASTRIRPGWWARRRCLESSLHITPDEAIMNRLDRSQRSGWASSWSRMGLEKVSPTSAICCTCSRSTVSSSSTQSSLRLVRVTVHPPMLRMMSCV